MWLGFGGVGRGFGIFFFSDSDEPFTPPVVAVLVDAHAIERRIEIDDERAVVQRASPAGSFKRSIGSSGRAATAPPRATDFAPPGIS